MWSKSLVELVWLYSYFLEYVFCRETEHFTCLGIFEILALAILACTSISCCSIVNDQVRYALFAQPCYYTTSLPSCQGVF